MQIFIKEFIILGLLGAQFNMELLAGSPLEVKNGFMVPPDNPGLGVELNRDALDRFVFSGVEELTIRPSALRSALVTHADPSTVTGDPNSLGTVNLSSPAPYGK